MKDLGKIMKCMELEQSNTTIAKEIQAISMLANFNKESSMATANTDGRMEPFTKDSGCAETL